MWYFLRGLWEEDGLTQRELSDRVGSMEPTTQTALRSMGKRTLSFKNAMWWMGERSMFFCEMGRKLEDVPLPQSVKIVERAMHGFSESERKILHRFLVQVRKI